VTKKMTEAEWWNEPAGAAACALLELPEDATIIDVWKHMLKRIAAAKSAPAVAMTPVDWSKKDDAALFAKLVGTPGEFAKEQRLRELAYAIVSRTATREELFALLDARIICEPKPGEIVVPGARLLQ
jgi:F0F1-type ATP synthase delta subunit